MDLTCIRLAALALTVLGTGCAIHVQGAVKEVAYDFSDAGYYDKDFAASPRYVQAREDGEAYASAGAWVARADEPAAPVAVAQEPELPPEMRFEPGVPAVTIDPAAD
jgi:hypothetical protein